MLADRSLGIRPYRAYALPAMRAYRSDNVIPIPGLLLLLAAAVAGGLLIGAVAFGVGRLVYLVFVWPVCMGVAGLLLLERVIKLGQVRNRAAAMLFGLLLGVIAYGSYHYFNYLLFRAGAAANLAPQLQAQGFASDASGVQRALDYSLRTIAGAPGFFGYLILRDRAGINVGHVFDTAYLNLGPWLTGAYWLFELAVVAGFPAFLASKVADRPYCAAHQRWYADRQHLGGLPAGQAAALLQRLEAGDFAQAGAMLAADAAVPSLELYLQSCNRCQQSDSRLQLETVTRQGRRLSARPYLQAALSPAEAATLIGAAASSTSDDGH